MLDDLSGITVVSLEQAVAAPFASSRLADAGARVIKIERREGDFARKYDRLVKGGSAYFVWLNRGKESVVLDIKNTEDVALLQRLIAAADVFIQNLRPRTTSRLGLDSSALRTKHPRLITCDISGYGEVGPYARNKAYDLIVQAESGLCSITGSPESPGRVGVSVCDIAAGMYAHAAILQALIARFEHGRGRGIKVSLFDGMADWMTVPLLQYQYGAHETQRYGVNHPTIAPYGAYQCGDGGRVVLSVQNPDEWTRFCSIVMGGALAVDDPRFHDNTARIANRSELDVEINDFLSGVTSAEFTRLLQRAEIAYGVINNVAQLVEHPVLRRTPVSTPQGTIDLVAPPAQFAGYQPQYRDVPDLGEHSEAVRKEFEN